MAKAEVLANLHHDLVAYKAGDTIDADEAAIERLQAIGVVKAIADAPKAEKAAETPATAPKAAQSNKKTKTTSKAK